jgi:hypothetical protein
VGSINVTVRFSEDELARLDELAQRMGKTRSDVVRSLISRFDEVLKQEVERERKRWIMIGFVAALESAILDPEVVLRFVRRNVDILGYPDFVIGMVKVKNRVVTFSHHDKLGHQLLSLVRAKVEEEVKKEEAELMQEEGEDEDSEGGRATPVRVRVSRPVRPNTMHAIPVATRYKAIISNKSAVPIPKPTATTTMGKPVNNNGGSGAKSTASTTAPDSKKLASAGMPTTSGLANTQPTSSNQRASTNGSGRDVPNPVGRGANHELAGDFVIALVTQSYHKHRDRLLKLMESIVGG